MQARPGAIAGMDYTLRLGSTEVSLHLTVKESWAEEMFFAIFAASEEETPLDFNQPLAGQNLNFSVTVRDVQSVGGGRIIVPGEV
jgi:FKBP-type peptidyl-prolyl cis-trans isomerase 2